MASRAVWKGHMRLYLVSIPIELHAASQTATGISFVQIHEP
jgi:DNA end-binding protein Ku